MTIKRSTRSALLLLGATVLTACAGKPGLESPVRTVGGTPYYTVTGRAAGTGSFDFTKKLAWLAAVSELSRARSAHVYARLTREERANLNRLLTRGRSGDVQGEIEGLVDIIEEATSTSPLRDVHELMVTTDGKELVVTLGIPLATWQELVEEAARERAWMSRGQVREVDRRQRRLP